MPISGISDFRRLPRIGKIKLGKKDETKKGAPYQTKYFVVPPEVAEVYGEEPTELDIMFPINDVEVLFPQYYKKYGQTGLLCRGDGNCANVMVDGKLVEKTCTPDDPKCKGCKPVGILNVLLPKVNGFGVYQIWTGSWNSIVNLNSAIDMILAMTGRKVAFIPLKLAYKEHNAIVKSKDGQFQKKVYVLSINIDTTMGEFYNQYSLDARIQKGIAESPQFEHLVDVSNKFKMLSESKQQDQFIFDDDEEELVEDEAIIESQEDKGEQEAREYIKGLRKKIKIDDAELTQIFVDCNQDLYLVIRALEKKAAEVKENDNK